jgi:hypothetical protein
MALSKLAVLTIAVLAAPMAVAQNQVSATSNTCNVAASDDMLHGSYNVTGGRLAMTIGGMTMFPDPETKGPGRIFAGETASHMVQMEGLPDFELTAVDSARADWTWDHSVPGCMSPPAFLSSKELAETAGCDNSEMPRFEAVFQTMSQEGIPLDHEIHVVMALPGWLFGTWNFVAQTPNGPASGYRCIKFERTAAR